MQQKENPISNDQFLYSDYLCSQHFSCSCLGEKIRCCSSWYESTLYLMILTLSKWLSSVQYYLHENLPNNNNCGYSIVLATVIAISFVEANDNGIMLVLGHCPSSQHYSISLCKWWRSFLLLSPLDASRGCSKFMVQTSCGEGNHSCLPLELLDSKKW